MLPISLFQVSNLIIFYVKYYSYITDIHALYQFNSYEYVLIFL